MPNRVISNHKKNRGTGEVNEEDVGSIIEEEEKRLGGGKGGWGCLVENKK